MDGREEYREVVSRALDIGEAMLVCGGEVSRVEDTVSRVLHSYGATRVDVFTIISCITLSATFLDGTVETQFRRVNIKAYATDLERLEQLNALSRELCHTKPPVSELRAHLMATEHTPSEQRHSDLFRCFGYMIAGSAFAIFFGGSPMDGVAAMLIALLTWALDLLLKKMDLQRLFHSFLVSFLAGVASLLIALTGVNIHAGQIMMGVIMLLIPGIAITNSMRDLLIGDTISGSLRLVESLLIACSVAIGFATAIFLSRGILPNNGLDTLAPLPYVQVLSAALGSFGFSLVFRIRRKRLLLCTLGGGLTWTVYLLCTAFVSNSFLCCAVAAAFGACYAEIMARVSKAPVISFIMATEIALIPGGTLFITMNELVSGNGENALLYASKTINFALAISLGIVLIAAFAGAFFHKPLLGTGNGAKKGSVDSTIH